jgi:hypothetical protein
VRRRASSEQRHQVVDDAPALQTRHHLRKKRVC